MVYWIGASNTYGEGQVHGNNWDSAILPLQHETGDVAFLLGCLIPGSLWVGRCPLGLRGATFRKFLLPDGMTSKGFRNCSKCQGHLPPYGVLPKRLSLHGPGFPIPVVSHTEPDRGRGSHPHTHTGRLLCAMLPRLHNLETPLAHSFSSREVQNIMSIKSACKTQLFLPASLTDPPRVIVNADLFLPEYAWLRAQASPY